MQSFNRQLRVRKLASLNKRLGDFAKRMVLGYYIGGRGGEWKPAPRGNNLYWARILVADVGKETFQRARGEYREALRRELFKWCPKENRCYEGHRLVKDVHPHNCPKCWEIRNAQSR